MPLGVPQLPSRWTAAGGGASFDRAIWDRSRIASMSLEASA